MGLNFIKPWLRKEILSQEPPPPPHHHKQQKAWLSGNSEYIKIQKRSRVRVKEGRGLWQFERDAICIFGLLKKDMCLGSQSSFSCQHWQVLLESTYIKERVHGCMETRKTCWSKQKKKDWFHLWSGHRWSLINLGVLRVVHFHELTLMAFIDR